MALWENVLAYNLGREGFALRGQSRQEGLGRQELRSLVTWHTGLEAENEECGIPLASFPLDCASQHVG